MCRFVALLATVCLLLPLVARARGTDLISVGSNPLVPAPKQVPPPTSPVPVTLDFILPIGVERLPGLQPADPEPLLRGNPLPPGMTESGQSEPPIIDATIFDGMHPWEIFHKGQWEVQFATGVLGHPVPGVGPQGPKMIFLPQLLRLGYVFNDSEPGRNRLKGSFEAIFELSTFPIPKGPGNFLLGEAWYLRYNFTKRFERLVPYFEMGGGCAYTDVYKFRPSNLSTGFEFILHIGAGCRYMINSKWAVSAEFDYFHFSDAGIGIHNFGVNAFGGTIGISRFFR